MNTITYKGKEYPTRTFTVFLGGEDRIITISTQSLSDAMGEDKEVHGTEANNIDETIYFYVDNEEILEMDAQEICENWLDESMSLIEDHDESDEDTRYMIQDLDETNIDNLNDSIDKEELIGLIDEETGGIIGYINTVHAKRIMDALNSIKYLEANLRKLN